MTDKREKGLQFVKDMVGEQFTTDHFDGFAAEIGDLFLEHAMGTIWSRPGLGRRDRSLLTIGMLIALRADSELKGHLMIGQCNGLTREEIEEIIYHATVYAGYPAAMAARKVAQDVVKG